MIESELHEAFVEEPPDRTGIVTLRDILNVKNITTTKLQILMNYIPRLSPHNTVGDATNLMFQYRIRSLPVYEGAEVKGQITSQSIAKRLPETELAYKASSVMTPEPICISSRDRVSKAQALMIRRKIDQVPVLKGGKLCGVVTSKSIVSSILPPVDRTIKGDWRAGRFDVPVEDFTDPDTVTNDASDSLQSVFENMNRFSANYSVIQNLGEVQGIVTYRDLMKLLKQVKVAGGVPAMYIVGLPEDPFEAEAAKEKFQRVVELLSRGFPDMTEARAVIKSAESKSPRKRFEVHIFIQGPTWHHNYRVAGYELPDAFDYIEGWAKKLMAKNQKREMRSRSELGYIPAAERIPARKSRK